METCANPGCSEPGTNKCSGCKTTPYCGPICQTAHWPTHKESCDGRLRKMGMDHLNKAKGFHREQNWSQQKWSQMLRHSDIAATKLKQLKDRPLQEFSDALELKCVALGFVDRHREQLECAKEWYCLWNTKPTDSCLNNEKYDDARLYASTLNGIINHKHDNKIPDDERQYYIAKGAYFLAKTILGLAESGGIPPEEKQKAGQEAIALARKALEIHTQLLGTEDDQVANDMCVLADVLDYFNDVDDDEVLRLYEQAIATLTRIFGSSAHNVALAEDNFANAYRRRARRAFKNDDLDRCLINLELSLPHSRDAARIFRSVNCMDRADEAMQDVAKTEEKLRLVRNLVATKAAVG